MCDPRKHSDPGCYLALGQPSTFKTIGFRFLYLFHDSITMARIASGKGKTPWDSYGPRKQPKTTIKSNTPDTSTRKTHGCKSTFCIIVETSFACHAKSTLIH